LKPGLAASIAPGTKAVAGFGSGGSASSSRRPACTGGAAARTVEDEEEEEEEEEELLEETLAALPAPPLKAVLRKKPAGIAKRGAADVSKTEDGWAAAA
jgi:hypothetical protein